jgi:hypothetical protein
MAVDAQLRAVLVDWYQHIGSTIRTSYLTAGQARMRDQLLLADHAHNDVKPITVFGSNATGGVFKLSFCTVVCNFLHKFLGSLGTTYIMMTGAINPQQISAVRSSIQ